MFDGCAGVGAFVPDENVQSTLVRLYGYGGERSVRLFIAPCLCPCGIVCFLCRLTRSNSVHNHCYSSHTDIRSVVVAVVFTFYTHTHTHADIHTIPLQPSRSYSCKCGLTVWEKKSQTATTVSKARGKQPTRTNEQSEIFWVTPTNGRTHCVYVAFNGCRWSMYACARRPMCMCYNEGST